MNKEDAAEIGAGKAPNEEFSFGKLLFSGFKTFMFVLTVGALFNVFFQFLHVVGNSMNDTLHAGELLVGVRPYFAEISRGDIVTVKHGSKLVVKRIIGIEGDTIVIDENGTFVNGEPFTLAYAGSEDNIFGEWQVSAGNIFIAGDNRADSIDSRTYGEVSADTVVSKVFFRYYPLALLGGVN